ncbi:pantoate--beta-alanine ligase [Amycolatopsis suaedae]|uniref:Pantothenate synthetase n=1 Tax=Amycolatopsis suaedae TaxID=2510978 RepID=A0A4Q7J3U5_9PSEU|nr:pantoate--beta-alanine ligase [Amycolatopsis suaedae]RZQ61647.1 pantoate--beta-alanine ligase [Amycolatopsis suaedae]
MTSAKTAPKFARRQLNVYQRPADVSRVSSALHGVSSKVALVPTMGALHAGHRELLRRARRLPNTVVAASIFVNPLQFGEGEDFDAYPRPLERDLEVLEEVGAELAFTPSVEDIYGEDTGITIEPGPLGAELEGASRPGHFAGVLTIVAKLLNIVRPDYVFFGEKDYQQLVLVKNMVRQLNFDTKVVPVPTVREHDGLALSSRNVYLSPDERQRAVALSAALTAGAHAGRLGADAVLDAANRTLSAVDGINLDYLDLRGTDLGAPPVDGEARLLIAAKLGRTRLIDNVPVLLGAAAEHPDDGSPEAGE